MSRFTGLSFIICHREEDDISVTAASIRNGFHKIKRPSSDYEIITVAGNQPSLQRNAAVDEARFSHIYFLDNDSLITPETLDYVIAELSSPEGESIAILGGPSLLNPQASFLELCIDGVLTSYAVVGRRCARYSQVGKARKSDSRELILCNMVISRRCFLSCNRFDYHLYPNEENDFMARIYRLEQGIVYAPEMYIYRHQRETYAAFIKQMYHYGRGKAEEFKKGISRKKLFWVRILWGLIFLIGIGILGVGVVETLMPEAVLSLPFRVSLALWLPHVVFWFLIYLSWVWLKASARKKRVLYHFPGLMILGYFFYGWGFQYFLFKEKYQSENKTLWFRIGSIYRYLSQ